MVIQVVNEFGAVGRVLCNVLAQIVQGEIGGEQLAWGQVVLTVLNVPGVVLTQTLPGDGIENEGAGFENDSDADVQVTVGYVVVKHAGPFSAAYGAPQQAGGVNPNAKDQRWRNETWNMENTAQCDCTVLVFNTYFQCPDKIFALM